MRILNISESPHLFLLVLGGRFLLSSSFCLLSDQIFALTALNLNLNLCALLSTLPKRALPLFVSRTHVGIYHCPSESLCGRVMHFLSPFSTVIHSSLLLNIFCTKRLHTIWSKCLQCKVFISLLHTLPVSKIAILWFHFQFRCSTDEFFSELMGLSSKY
jgi:hypothetical protein